MQFLILIAFVYDSQLYNINESPVANLNNAMRMDGVKAKMSLHFNCVLMSLMKIDSKVQRL